MKNISVYRFIMVFDGKIKHLLLFDYGLLDKSKS